MDLQDGSAADLESPVPIIDKEIGCILCSSKRMKCIEINFILYRLHSECVNISYQTLRVKVLRDTLQFPQETAAIAPSAVEKARMEGELRTKQCQRVCSYVFTYARVLQALARKRFGSLTKSALESSSNAGLVL